MGMRLRRRDPVMPGTPAAPAARETRGSSIVRTLQAEVRVASPEPAVGVAPQLPKPTDMAALSTDRTADGGGGACVPTASIHPSPTATWLTETRLVTWAGTGLVTLQQVPTPSSP